MAFEKYTVREFMNALFNGDRSVMNEEELNIVNTEYIDVANLYETEDFVMSVYIEYVTNRINTIKGACKLHIDFVEEFGTPFTAGLKIFKEKGHSIKWTNKEKFIKDIQRIEQRERVYISQLESKIKERDDHRANRPTGEVSTKIKRGSFIKTLNSLGKVGYRIDNDKTTVEELAYMIKQQVDEVKALQ